MKTANGFNDLTDQRFGRLTVVSREGSDKNRSATWRCVCECGTGTIVTAGNLRSGHTLSCGCLAREATSRRMTTHGMRKTRTHKSWTGMKDRCTNPKVRNYKNYGARGVTVCQRWMDSFEAFLSDVGECPEGMSIDRIDSCGNYEPGNCRWATPLTQGRNTRRNRILSHDGLSMCVSEWVEKTGIPSTTIRNRIDELGWSVERALTEPLNKPKPRSSHVNYVAEFASPCYSLVTHNTGDEHVFQRHTQLRTDAAPTVGIQVRARSSPRHCKAGMG